MNIFPAIDIYEGAAVRLFKGDYNQMTVYDKNPLNIAKKFEEYTYFSNIRQALEL